MNRNSLKEWPPYLEQCGGLPMERKKWYDERDADSVACILKEGSYIIGPPEQFFDDDWMSYAKSTLPPRSKDKHYIDEDNETYLFRVKKGTEIYITYYMSDKVVFTNTASGLIAITSVENIVQGRYRHAMRFDVKEPSRLVLKYKDDDFRHAIIGEHAPTGLIYFGKV